MKITLFLIAVYSLIIYRSQQKSLSGNRNPAKTNAIALRDSLPGYLSANSSFTHFASSTQKGKIISYPFAGQQAWLPK